jgi:hypothetical protein
MRNVSWTWLLVLVLLLVVGGTWYVLRPASPRPFDAAEWKTGDRRDQAAMLSDLKNSGHLSGLPPAEAEELLGPPDSRHASEDHTIWTYVGFPDDGGPPTSSIWTKTLYIRFEGMPPRVVDVWTDD